MAVEVKVEELEVVVIVLLPFEELVVKLVVKLVTKLVAELVVKLVVKLVAMLVLKATDLPKEELDLIVEVVRLVKLFTALVITVTIAGVIEDLTKFLQN